MGIFSLFLGFRGRGIIIAHTSALEMTQLSNVVITDNSTIKTFNDCDISKADVWAMRPTKIITAGTWLENFKF